MPQARSLTWQREARRFNKLSTRSEIGDVDLARAPACRSTTPLVRRATHLTGSRSARAAPVSQAGSLTPLVRQATYTADMTNLHEAILAPPDLSSGCLREPKALEGTLNTELRALSPRRR